jgi:hypothetical protein
MIVSLGVLRFNLVSFFMFDFLLTGPPLQQASDAPT